MSSPDMKTMQLTRFFHFVFYLLREGRELMHHHCYPGLSCDVSVASRPVSCNWIGYYSISYIHNSWNHHIPTRTWASLLQIDGLRPTVPAQESHTNFSNFLSDLYPLSIGEKEVSKLENNVNIWGLTYWSHLWRKMIRHFFLIGNKKLALETCKRRQEK